jgi:hypothetical protein
MLTELLILTYRKRDANGEIIAEVLDCLARQN